MSFAVESERMQEKMLELLVEAFPDSSVVAIADAYAEASGDINLAAQILAASSTPGPEAAVMKPSSQAPTAPTTAAHAAAAAAAAAAATAAATATSLPPPPAPAAAYDCDEDSAMSFTPEDVRLFVAGMVGKPCNMHDAIIADIMEYCEGDVLKTIDFLLPLVADDNLPSLEDEEEEGAADCQVAEDDIEGGMGGGMEPFDPLGGMAEGIGRQHLPKIESSSSSGSSGSGMSMDAAAAASDPSFFSLVEALPHLSFRKINEALEMFGGDVDGAFFWLLENPDGLPASPLQKSLPQMQTKEGAVGQQFGGSLDSLDFGRQAAAEEGDFWMLAGESEEEKSINENDDLVAKVEVLKAAMPSADVSCLGQMLQSCNGSIEEAWLLLGNSDLDLSAASSPPRAASKAAKGHPGHGLGAWDVAGGVAAGLQYQSMGMTQTRQIMRPNQHRSFGNGTFPSSPAAAAARPATAAARPAAAAASGSTWHQGVQRRPPAETTRAVGRSTPMANFLEDSGGGGGARMEGEGGDRFKMERKHAMEMQRMMSYYFQQADAADKRGERSRGAALRAEGVKYYSAYKKAQEKAGGRIFASNNAGIKNVVEVDLHGLLVHEAIEKVDDHLAANCILQTFAGLKIITGWGAHSGKGGPKIKPAVIKHLEHKQLKWTEVNRGCLYVHLK